LVDHRDVPLDPLEVAAGPCSPAGGRAARSRPLAASETGGVPRDARRHQAVELGLDGGITGRDEDADAGHGCHSSRRSYYARARRAERASTSSTHSTTIAWNTAPALAGSFTLRWRESAPTMRMATRTEATPTPSGCMRPSTAMRMAIAP